MVLPTPKTRPPSILSILNERPRFKVVDIGANPEDGITPPYFPLLETGDVDVIGFEPNAACLAKLNAKKKSNETYFPYTIGDGQRRTLHWCRAPGMSSLLEPNEAVMKLLHGFPAYAKVLATTDVETVRLDDIPETVGTEFIKIDVQGGELIALSGATRRLKDVLAVHTEVMFIPMYKDQPLFADIESFMRQQGFILHRFIDMGDRALSPFAIDQTPHMPGSQAVWSDAVFVRDLTRLERFADRQLHVLAVIAHAFYGSYDLTTFLLGEHDRRHGTDLAGRYVGALRPYYGDRKVDLMYFEANDGLG